MYDWEAFSAMRGANDQIGGSTMKKILLISALLLAACAKQPVAPVVKAPEVSRADCDKTYEHLVYVTTVGTNTDFIIFEPDEESLKMVDNFLILKGIKKEFYDACLAPTTTKLEINCMQSSDSIDGMQRCVDTYRKK